MKYGIQKLSLALGVAGLVWGQATASAQSYSGLLKSWDFEESILSGQAGTQPAISIEEPIFTASSLIFNTGDGTVASAGVSLGGGGNQSLSFSRTTETAVAPNLSLSFTVGAWEQLTNLELTYNYAIEAHTNRPRSGYTTHTWSYTLNGDAGTLVSAVQTFTNPFPQNGTPTEAQINRVTLALIDAGTGQALVLNEGDTLVLSSVWSGASGTSQNASLIDNIQLSGGGQVIPEPSTYALIFGLFVLAGVVVKRRLRK